jgi:glycosyltransferase involved in cell wall biosynthesis
MKFSIAIPAYKGTYLKDAIASCLSQTYLDYEVVVVDDASPENLQEIVNGFTDSRVLYFRNEKNCGSLNVVDNWNISLSHCSGDYVICMGDDDRLLPNCLMEYANLIQKYPGLGVYHAWTEIIDENSKFRDIQHPRPEFETGLSMIWNRWNGRDRQYIGDFCFDVKMLKADGGFFKLPLAWFSDDITALRAACHSGIANTQTLCFQYRENSRSLTNSGNVKAKLLATMQGFRWYGEFFERLNSEKSRLTETDCKYLELLLKQLPLYYRERQIKWIKQDISQNILGVFFWVTHMRQYDLKFKLVVSGFYRGLKRRMGHK